MKIVEGNVKCMREIFKKVIEKVFGFKSMIRGDYCIALYALYGVSLYCIVLKYNLFIFVSFFD